MSYSKVKKRNLKFSEQPLEKGTFHTYKASWWQGWITWKDVTVQKVHKLDVNELEIMSSLDHKNIVKLLGVVDESPQYYLILELYEGGTLRHALDRCRSSAMKYDRKKWIEQATMALEYLKQNRIVHHEIKSQNYVIDRKPYYSNSYMDTNLKLMNFKHAERVDITKISQVKMTSYPWTAPEFMREGKVAEPFPTFDIFSLSVVMWEIYTTESPYIVHGYAQVSAAMSGNSKDENAEHLPIPRGCPWRLTNLMKQCWHKDWKKRPTIEHVVDVVTRKDLLA